MRGSVRWAVPALIAVLVLAAVIVSDLQKASARPEPVATGDVAEAPAKAAVQDVQPTVANGQDPAPAPDATNAEDDVAEESTVRDPALAAYVRFLQNAECKLTERQKQLDTKAVKGVTRTELHSLGYRYPEIEASFKRILRFIER